jgi:hypothetical protein
MKPWFSLTIVCWALLCLLLSLSQQAGLNYYQLQVAGSGQWFDPCREPASGLPTAAVLRNMEFDSARAGPLTSLVLGGAWTANNIGPPGQQNLWATGTDRTLAGRRSKPAAQNNIQLPCYC